MTLVQKFTEKYGINPIKLVEDANLKNFGLAKTLGLQRLLEVYIEDKNLNIEVNNEFLKDLVECFAEAGEKFPENVKASVDTGTKFEVPNQMSGVPKSKGTLENFKDIVGTDDLRPIMMGVYVSEDGFLVGTDAHKLVKLKTNEFSENKGKIIDLPKYLKSKGKLLDFIDGVYPKYDAVIPRENPYEDRALSTYAFYNYVKSSLDVKRLVDAEIFNINFNLMTDTSGETTMFSFAYHILFDALNFAMLNGWDVFTLRYSEPNRAVVFDFGGDNIILVMPIIDRYGSGASGGSTGTIPLTTEEVEEKYRLGKTNQSKPAKAPKKPTVSAPASSEPFKKFDGNLSDTTYVHRSQIESINLVNGEVLGKNDVIDGFYRVNKKMAHGGNLGESGTKTYKLRAEGLNDFMAFLQNDMYFKVKSFTVEITGFPDVVVTFETASSLSEIKEKLKGVPDSHVMLETVKPIKEYTGEREGSYAHGGSMYAGGGNTTSGIDFLRSKGYDFDGDYYFEADGEFIEVAQGSKGTSKEVAVYFKTDEPITISRPMLDKISSSFGKSFDIKLFTNAGVDLHSSEKDKFKNISIERIKMAHGGSMYADGGLIAYADGDIDSEIGRFSSFAEAKKFAKANKWRYNTISFQDENYDEILVSKEDSFQDIDWLFSGKMARGGGVNMEKLIKLRELDSGKITTWTLSEVIERINQDNYDDSFAYDESDWQDGFKETLEGQFYSLYDKNGNPLNDNLKMAHGGSTSSSHEIGDTVTFNSVLGGTKTGTIISKIGDEGFRIKTGDGFATVKKSAIV